MSSALQVERLPEFHIEEKSRDTYDPVYFKQLFAIEDRHFWFRARNKIIATLVRQIAAQLPDGYRMLEIGCGIGKVLAMLEKVCRRGSLIGMDRFGEGLHFARRRTHCPLVQADVLASPFGVQLDIIGIFDVLEHLPDDLGVLRGVHNLLKPGGHLLLTVPAHMSLWSYFDEASHHCRRYEEPDLAAKLEAAGYEVEYISEYMAALFPLMWLGRRAAAQASRVKRGATNREQSDDLASNELQIFPFMNDLLSRVLVQETRLVEQRRHIPVGTSLLVVARRRE